MENNKTYIGIDVGKSGFISMRTPQGGWSHYEIPKVNDKVVDYHSLNRLFRDFVSKGDIFCTIENVHAIFGSSAAATFSFGDINGYLRAMLFAYDIPHVYIQPKEWQKEMWKGITPVATYSTIKRKDKDILKKNVDTKATSMLAAKSLFPTMDFRRTERCKSMDDNKIDSILLCEYGRRMNF